MADFGAPVAAGIQPSNALQTLSGILGLRQQQAQLQEQQALAQQQTQTAEQRAGLRSFFQNFDLTQHIGADGTLDLNSTLENPALRQAAGDQFPAVATALIGIKQHQLTAKQTLVTLDQSTREQLQQQLGALRTNPDVIHDTPAGRQLVDRTVQAFGQLSPEAARVAAVYGPMVSQVPQGRLDRAINDVQLQAMSAGQQAQAQQPSYTATGAGLVQTNPQAPGGNIGASPNLPQRLPPQIVTPPGGNPYAVGGSGGTGGGPIVNPYPGPAPTQQDWNNFSAYARNLDERVQVATDSIPRIQLAEEALGAIRSGAGSSVRADIAKQLQAVDAPQSLVDAVAGGNLAKTLEGEKLLFQSTLTGLKQSMQGDPSRVAQFEAAEKVFPNVDTDPRARSWLLNFFADQGKRDYAEQQALIKSRETGTFNPVTWQATYQRELRAGQVPGVPQSQIPGTAPGSVSAQFPKPNAAQLELLQKHPEYAHFFEQKFGYLPQGYK